MDVFAWDGIGPQPGYAGELAGVAPLSLLPPEGEVRFVGPGDRPQPSVPYLYDVHATGERWALSTPRDFAADLVAVEEAIARVDATYYWAPYVSGYVAPLAFFYDDEQCFSDEVVITSGSGDTLEVASPPAGDGVWIGYAVKEAVYDTGDTADTSGFELTSVGVATAHIEEIAGTSVVGMPSGVTLSYDEFSGYFLDAGVGATLGSAELPNNAVFDLAYTRMEQTEDLGTVASGAALVVTKPDLLDGQRLINVEKDFTVRWLPGDGVVSIDIVVYDYDIDDPNWYTEVARLVVRADDSAGEFVIPATDLDELPLADNAFDANYDQVGLWAEMTIARHTLRPVALADGENLVIDFLHAANGPVKLVTR